MSVRPGPPANWHLRRGLLLLGICTILGGAVFLLYWTIRCVLLGELMTAATVGGFAIFFAGLSIAGCRTRLGGIGVPQPVPNGGSVLLRPDGIAQGTATLGKVFGVIGGVLFAVYGPSGSLDIVMTGGQRIFYPVGVGVISLGVAYDLVNQFRHRPVGIRLTADQVRFPPGLGRRRFDWAEITDIADRTPKGKSQNGRPIVVHLTDGDRFVFDDADWYAPGGAALYWLLRYYWIDPDRRVELADGRAAERFRAGNLPTT